MRLTAVYSLASLVAANTAWAQGDLTRQEPIVVRVNLGNADDARVFEPAGMTFETGKLYRLVLHNPSKTKHFHLARPCRPRFTRKVEVMGPDGVTAVSEIKGAIREIEVFPGGTAEWWFVPVATVGGAELYCHVKDEDGKTHTKKDMVGSVDIK